MPTKNDFDEGFVSACSQIRDWVSEAHQKLTDDESHRVLDWIWDQIKIVENKKLGREPFSEVTVKTSGNSDT